MPKPIPIPASTSSRPDIAEEETVHAVYDKIAPHFAQTRFKPWPLIDSFLKSQPPNSIGLDSGAGNGKYLPVASEAGSYMVALDRSLGLLEHAQKQVHGGIGGGEGGECVRGDLGCRSWRHGVFDFTISIAALHHLSTPIRRRQAIQALLPALHHGSTPPYSRFMLYVWAYEQGTNSRRKMGTTAVGIDRLYDEEISNKLESTTLSPDGQDAKGGEEEKEQRVQDVLVPWVLPTKRGESSKPTRRPQQNPQDHLQNSGEPPTSSKAAQKEEEEPTVLHRYYHLFVEGELRALVEEAALEEGYRIVDEGDATGEKGNVEGKWMCIKGVGWEADNWWLEGEVGIGARII